MNPDLWDVMHDSYIASIHGLVPGDINVTISIEYLREMWDDGGHRFIVELKNCTLFEWHAWKTNGPHETATNVITDLSAIAENLPEIMTGAQVVDDKLKVYLDIGSPYGRKLDGKEAGWLRLKYTDTVIKLDNGQVITLDEIKEKAASYWHKFRRD